MEQDDGTWIVTRCDSKLSTSLRMHEDTSFKRSASLIHSISVIILDIFYRHLDLAFYPFR